MSAVASATLQATGMCNWIAAIEMRKASKIRPFEAVATD
jgi:hypothetical protein